jgi:translocation and assembly module TamB
VIEEVQLEGEGLELRAMGSGTLSRIERLEVEGHLEELQRLAGLLPALEASGKLEAHAEIRGGFDRPEGNLRVAGEGLALRGVALGTLDLRVRATGEGLLHVDSFSFSGGRIPVAAAPGARLRVRPGGVGFEALQLVAAGQSLAVAGGLLYEGFDDLVLDGAALELGTLGALAGAPVELGGRADAHLELRGRFGSPTATGSVEWRAPRFGTTRLEAMNLELAAAAGNLRIQADLRDQGRSLLIADLRVPEAPLGLSLQKLATTTQFALELRAAQLDLSLLEPLRSLGLPELRGVLDGQLDFAGGAPFPARASLVLGAERFSMGDAVPIDLELALADLGQGWLGVEQLRMVRSGDSFEALPGARLRVGERGIRFEGLQLLARDQQLRIDGGVGLRRFDGLQIEAQDLDVEALTDMVDARFEVTGRLDTKVELRGPFSDPSVNGSAQWRGASFAGLPLDQVDLDLQTVDGRIRGTGNVRRAGDPVARGTALLPPTPWASDRSLLTSEELDVELRAGHLELALLEPWLPSNIREPRGSARGWLRLRGREPRPSLAGSLELRDGSLSVPLLGRTLAPISAKLDLGSDSLQIETLQIGPPGHDAVLSGTLGIEVGGFGDADLHLALREFPLSQTGFAQANANGAIRVSGPRQQPNVNGELVLSEVLIRLPEPRDPAFKEIRVLANPADPAALRESSEAPDGFGGQADIDLGLTVPAGSRIRGRGADLAVSGELRLRKPRGEPAAYTGSLRADRGTYRLHGRRFELRRGSASFDGRPDPDPLLDIEAAHRTQDVTILVQITGRASDPTVRLRSEPVLPEKDVLAYLLFGRAADRVARSQQAALQSAAAGLAAGRALTEVETVLGKDLPIDSVDVRVEEDGSVGEVGVGGRLTERLSFRYGRTLGVDPEDQVGVEIQLSPSWSLQSEVTSSGKAGADVIWSLDY